MKNILNILLHRDKNRKELVESLKRESLKEKNSIACELRLIRKMIQKGEVEIVVKNIDNIRNGN